VDVLHLGIETNVLVYRTVAADPVDGFSKYTPPARTSGWRIGRHEPHFLEKLTDLRECEI
jgi:hypothetical protein